VAFFRAAEWKKSGEGMSKKHLIIGLWVIIIWIVSPSSVMGQDPHSHHGTPAEAAKGKPFQAKMSAPFAIRQGQSFIAHIHIQDDKGRRVSDFEIFQEKLMHLILVSDDLGFFLHLHPEYRSGGHFQTNITLPFAGTYTMFCDYKPAGHHEQLSVLKLHARGVKKAPDIKDIQEIEKTVDDIKVRLIFSPKTVKANEETVVTFDLRQASDDKPVTGLQPYLGEKGHLVVIRKSTALTAEDYIHAHAMKEGKESEIQFMTRFPKAGLYKMWCQFNRGGRILTADFRIDVNH